MRLDKFCMKKRLEEEQLNPKAGGKWSNDERIDWSIFQSNDPWYDVCN